MIAISYDIIPIPTPFNFAGQNLIVRVLPKKQKIRKMVLAIYYNST